MTSQHLKTFFRQIAYIAVLSGLCALQTSCVQEEDMDNTPKGNFEALWQIIDQRYCYFDYKEKAIGLDWNLIHSKYESRLNPKMSRMQLFQVLCEMLSELQDGHVNLYGSADIGRNWSWHEDYPQNLDHEVREGYLGKDYRIAGGLKYRILEDNIGYVLYESFSHGVGEGNLDDVMYYLRLCDGLILDLRGNSGGTLTYAERLSERFTNEPLLVGYTSHKTGRGHNDFSEPQPEYIHPSKGVRWQKPAIVLTNRECYSATNTFVRNIKECPLVTVLGDRTGGGGGLPFSSELPAGWAVRFSACPMYDAHMNHIEFGIEPDIECALDSTALLKGKDSIIEMARHLLKP